MRGFGYKVSMLAVLAMGLIACGPDAGDIDKGMGPGGGPGHPDAWVPPELPGPGEDPLVQAPDGTNPDGSTQNPDGSTQNPDGEPQQNGEGGASPGGPLTITLLWDQATDLDLHVVTPSGEELYYRNRNSSDGGRMVKDDCIESRCPERTDGSSYSEAVIWEGPANEGVYEVWAYSYNGAKATDFHIEIEFEGGSESFSGNLASKGAESEHFNFTHGDPNNAPEPVENDGAEPNPDANSACTRRLNELGIEWQHTSPERNMTEEPVMITPPIAGLDYRYVSRGGANYQHQDARMRMTCQFALTLVRMAESLRPYNIKTVLHIGAFVNKPRQHGYGRALDIFGFIDASGRDYILEQHWEHGSTNPSSVEGKMLYDVSRSWHGSRLFNVILTPEYNADHDNHFHVDSTPGSHFWGLTRLPSFYWGPPSDDHSCGAH